MFEPIYEVPYEVVSSNTSCLEAHEAFFRLLMKSIFDLLILMYCDLLTKS